MIDALFGSKTRVKLLHLFLNNPGQSFYVREITRLIDEQINSVRRELSNMLEVGVITSDSADNKLYYQVSQRYEYYLPLRAIFADQKITTSVTTPIGESPVWHKAIAELSGVRVAVAAGALVQGSTGNIDLLLAGNMTDKHVASLVATIESDLGRELSYTVLPYDEFYYRLSVHDQFIGGIVRNKHQVLIDTDGVLK
ncbi:MAG: transcriptional regulator [Candidatus Saccharimonas sp.]